MCLWYCYYWFGIFKVKLATGCWDGTTAGGSERGSVGAACDASCSYIILALVLLRAIA